jgi:Flp pilus assembly protein TadD
LFCRGRLQIAEGQFTEAVSSLQGSIQRDGNFACAYNALGVALERLNRGSDSRRAFEAAARLTPEWALPPFQIASQLIAAGDLKKAVPYLEKAVAYNPRSTGTRWSLMRVHRSLRQFVEVERDAEELIRINPNYAPAYLELGRTYEENRAFGKAAEAYETYLLLAPNYGDSDEIRARAKRIRGAR